jgi:hypothetical protein
LADTATSHRELIAKVEQYQDAELIALDGPPRIAALSTVILVLAETVFGACSAVLPNNSAMNLAWTTFDGVVNFPDKPT